MTVRPLIRTFCLALLLGCCADVRAAGLVLDSRAANLDRAEQPALMVPFVSRAPKVDGRTDEPVWKQAAVLRQWREHVIAVPSALPAEVRLMTDGKAIYVGFTVAVADMSKAVEAMGYYAEDVTEPSEIIPALRRAFDKNGRNRPAYLEFICSQYPVWGNWITAGRTVH